ncbi:hypothetical protein evm_000584 [Chilo suppressalis]|nr:hypothetical protein evm_000584 [Chilo suppressalis]
MDTQKILLLLTETTLISSDDSDTSWGDSLSIKQESDLDDDVEDPDDDRLFFPLMHYLIRLRRKRVDDYLHIIESWTDYEFKKRLRLSRKTAFRLIDDLEKSGAIASHNFGLKPLEPRLCFYIFLSFMGNTETLTPIASRFDISISSTFRVVRKIVAWILTKLNEAIKWPNDYDEITSICNSFYTKTGISDVLGVIDTTHIKIKKLKNGREYNNNKGYYSIILQATVDSNLRFTNIFCGEPGSNSCTQVLKKSPLYVTASDNRSMLFPHNTFLVGHSGYPTLPWLLPPFRENKRLTTYQRQLNCKHLQSRKISNRAFSLLKGRFRRIKVFNVYRNINFIIDTIVAACILHNYCHLENDYLDEQE